METDNSVVQQPCVHNRRKVAVFVAGCLLLLARGPLARATGAPTATLVALFGALLLVASPRRADSVGAWRRDAPLVLASGVVVFVAGRALLGGHGQTFTVEAVALDGLAAVAEEALFRGLGYDVLAARGGGALAIVGSALLFAAAHVTVYGLWVVPLDAAAGLVLGWQRWASGRWEVPAATHVVANLLMRI